MFIFISLPCNLPIQSSADWTINQPINQSVGQSVSLTLTVKAPKDFILFSIFQSFKVPLFIDAVNRIPSLLLGVPGTRACLSACVGVGQFVDGTMSKNLL